jgi:hypothetical protein
MIRAVHYKFNAGRYLTKFSYNQFVIIKFIKMCNMTFKISIGKISKISNNNIFIVTIQPTPANKGHEGVVAAFCRNGGGGNPLV